MHVLKVVLEVLVGFVLVVVVLAGVIVGMISHDMEDGENPFQ